MRNHFILKELSSIQKNVEKDLRKKGLVPAKKSKDGTIKIGSFFIMKETTGFYSILDNNSNKIVDGINLPHSAAILANNLALGRWTNREILDLDRKYGHYTFDEQLCKKYFTRNFENKKYDKAEIMNEKYRIAKNKKNYYKNKILEGFNKLIKIE